EKIDGKIYNAGWQNLAIRQIAELVRQEVGDDVRITTSPTDDLRSYHISSEKIKRELGWVPKRTVADAVLDLLVAFRADKVTDPMTNARYYNIRTMQALMNEHRQSAA
ncbi:MAG TPA: hypothetical protein VGX78_22650, partial [Pirellulales bacterium]|nr:hypothetical protein [Pirellulales bacterium]